MTDTDTPSAPQAIVAAGLPNSSTAVVRGNAGGPPNAVAHSQQPLSGEVLPPSRGGVKRFILPLVVLAILGGGGWYGWDWYANGRFIVSTDDAYVRADMATIAAKVAGYVATVSVGDNASVKSGDLLATVDDGDYKLAVEAARRKVETQDSTIARIEEQARAQSATIDQAQAGLESAKADAVRANAEFERATNLSKSGFGTQQRNDQALADRDRAAAAVRNATAAVQAARGNLAVLQAQKAEAQHARAELQTALERAQRDLMFTEIRAPFDGVVGNKAVQPGQYVQPGTRLLALVPLRSAYVEANFKETQLGRLKPGQPVSFSVDSAGDRRFEGTVDSFAPASGSQFSLLPPENATGNFTKIVQRFPVRIRVPAEIAAQGLLRPGTSVIVNVQTRDPALPKPTLMGALGLERPNVATR